MEEKRASEEGNISSSGMVTTDGTASESKSPVRSIESPKYSLSLSPI